jgi:DNA-directed RNA polymerase specialized sigma24 family protein
VLHAYLLAFERLSERERYVLQMVEVRRMRYAGLAQILGIRPEALKMVVFRARKRIHERLGNILSGVSVLAASKPIHGNTRSRLQSIASAVA